MAWYSINFACGHTQEVQLYGSGRERDYRKYAMERGLCPDCEARERSEKASAAAEEADSRGFAPLCGTPKQVEWAELIRKSFVELVEEDFNRQAKHIAERIESHPEKADELKDELKEGTNIYNIGFNRITTISSAKWWIEKRDTAAMTLLMNEYNKTSDATIATPGNAVADDAAVKAEATVEPLEKKHHGAVEILMNEKTIILKYVNNEDFKTLVKAAGYRWDSRRIAWTREIVAINGTVEDRAADIGNALLRAGFAITVFNDEIRSKAVDADFEQECKHWVVCRISGEYKGWLALKFPRNDAFVENAKRIKGAKWSDGSIVLPINQCDQVLDFADCNGYNISEGATAAIKAYKDNLVCVTPAVPEIKEPEKKDPADILKSSRDVLPDLLDE